MAAGPPSIPFLDLKSFTAQELQAPEPEVVTSPTLRSPFLSIYELPEGESAIEDPLREAYSTVAGELYDEEFDEALFELLTDARNLHQDQLASGHSASEAEGLVSRHFSQLIRESEAVVDAMAREFEARNETAIAEGEIESFLAQYAPSVRIEPSFEKFVGRFFKKIGKAVTTVASKAAQVAKKLGLAPILNRIKALIRPLLNKVLQMAIGKLPVAVQPAAQKLAEKLGFAAPKPLEPVASPPGDSAAAGGDVPTPPESAGAPVQPTAGSDVSQIQQEFDEQIAEALLAQDEAEFNLEVARLQSASPVAAAPVFANLDDARERFIQELENLKPGESPEPYVQNFLPAILPVLRIGLRLAGRPRVVNFIAQLLAKLIAKLIGPEQAPALSQAIVDAGLKLLNLEMSEQEKSGLAASAVAATVEEAVNRVASLPGHILDDQELLEGFVLEAFEQAAAANLPAVLSEAIYSQRPELLEAGVNAAWLPLPLRQRKKYKRCTRAFKIRIKPHVADEVESFEGVPLSEYLQDQLGLPEGAEVEAEMHLYEALPGITAADIARNESDTLGLGSSEQPTVSQLHPLTPRAASALLGKPGLGRDLPSGSSRWNLAAGQRLFHLVIPGKRPLTVPGPWGRRVVPRLSHINVTLDFPGDQIRACIFISEVKAQKLAARLRQLSHPGSLSVGFNKFVARRLGPIMHGQSPRRLRVLHPGIPPGRSAESILQKLPGNVPQGFVTKMQEWLVHGFSEFIKTQSQQFLKAIEDPSSDGVTLRFTLEHPHGLKELGQALVEKGPPGSKIAETISQASQPNTRVEVLPGHKCD